MIVNSGIEERISVILQWRLKVGSIRYDSSAIVWNRCFPSPGKGGMPFPNMRWMNFRTRIEPPQFFHWQASVVKQPEYDVPNFSARPSPAAITRPQSDGAHP
jgi:hypothetical protein